MRIIQKKSNRLFFIERQITIPFELAANRLDVALAKLLPEFSRTLLQQWIRNGEVQVNGCVKIEPKIKVNGGETLHIVAKIIRIENPKPEAIVLDVIYEDKYILVVNKPAGLVTHPGAGQPDGTLQNALLYHEPSLELLPRAGIVHRLDKYTSGLLVVAKTLPARAFLIRQLHKRMIKRQYEGIVVGKIISGCTISAPLKRHHQHRTRMVVSQIGRKAITHYRIKEHFLAHTSLTVTLETGRTHQIRTHLAYINHPLVGDPVYGGRLKIPPRASKELIQAIQNFKRQALHAERLELLHPITKQLIWWQAPLPEDMENLKKTLRNDALE